MPSNGKGPGSSATTKLGVELMEISCQMGEARGASPSEVIAALCAAGGMVYGMHNPGQLVGLPKFAADCQAMSLLFSRWAVQSAEGAAEYAASQAPANDSKGEDDAAEN